MKDREKAPGELVGFDWDGKTLGKVAVKSPRPGWYEFRPLDGGRRYLFSAASAGTAGKVAH